jgi:pyroglutamyl-peptidase
LQTGVDLEKLVMGSAEIEISHDCGKFICPLRGASYAQRLEEKRRESIYYSVLNYLCQNQLTTYCIFVHIPVLNQENLLDILADFVLIINNLALI